uniref:Uncharacterized protein n=1 Tax=Arion vulgaris TaxID=1028688 RepID=A0A0B7BCI4_9EUPU
MINQLTFIFVPGHVGVHSNDGADHLADTAVIEDRRPMKKCTYHSHKRSRSYRSP